MSDLEKRLKAQRGNVWEQMKSLLDAADAESRSMDSEESATWDRLNGEIQKLDERIKNVTEGEARVAAINETVEQFETRAGREVAKPENRELVQEIRDWFTKRNPNDSLEVRGTDKRIMKAINEQRALSKLSNGAGGYAVGTDFYGQLVQNMIVNSAILQAGARVLQTADGAPLQIPVTTGHASAALVAETAQIGTSEPVLGQYTLTAYKYGDMMYASRELVDDSDFDIESFLAEDAGRAVGNALGTHLITGTGSSQPRGLLTDTTLGVTSGTGVAGVPTADNLIDLYYSVSAPYRNQPSAAWLMNDATVGVVRKFKDSTGQYIWQPGLQAGVPDTLLGKAIYTDPNMPTTGVNNKSVAFGDLSKYWVRLVGGLRFERSVDFKFDTDLISYRAIIRADGALVDRTGAVKHFVGAAT